jgi:hypothetical protein
VTFADPHRSIGEERFITIGTSQDGRLLMLMIINTGFRDESRDERHRSPGDGIRGQSMAFREDFLVGFAGGIFGRRSSTAANGVPAQTPTRAKDGLAEYPDFGTADAGIFDCGP